MFNAIVLKRLMMSKRNRAPLSLSRLNEKVQENKTMVVIGKVTNDVRVHNIKKMRLAAMAVSETARKRIIEAGGEIITLDQLAQQAPTGLIPFFYKDQETKGQLTDISVPQVFQAATPGHMYDQRAGNSKKPEAGGLQEVTRNKFDTLEDFFLFCLQKLEHVFSFSSILIK